MDEMSALTLGLAWLRARVGWFRVGGIWFARCGRLRLSFCIARRVSL